VQHPGQGERGEEIKEKLRAVDVDYAQGFGITKPRPF
jgi:hypothetical protein